MRVPCQPSSVDNHALTLKPSSRSSNFGEFSPMDGLKIHKDVNDDRVFCGHVEFPDLNCRKNVTSQGLFELLKFSMLAFLINGADRVLKDRKLLKTTSLVIDRQKGSESCDRGFLCENGEKWNCNLETCQGSGEGTSRKQRKMINCTMLENEKVGVESDYPLLQPREDRFDGTCQWNKESVDVSEVVKSPSGGYSEFPFNFLAFLAILVMKSVGFQFSLFVSFLTFPIWLSYFSITLLMFPFQTLSHIRMYLMKKMLRMWSATSVSATSSICERVKAESSMVKLAMRFGQAFFWSIYVCSMLVGLLVLGFVIGGFTMERLVEDPIQITETLNFDYTKTSPVAFVPIMSSPIVGAPSGLISKDNVEAGKQNAARFIPYNHKLQLIVSLILPESQYNRKLGVFQVRLEFLSANGKVTATSSYPCMLRFKSQPIRFVETFLKSAPLIAGFQSESQILNIKMSDFTEGIEPTACLRVILEQRAEYLPGAGIPEIYAASLALESELPQLKRIIWSWRRTIFVWTSMISFLTELVFILVFCRPIIIPRGKLSIVSSKKDPHPNAISWYRRD